MIYKMRCCRNNKIEYDPFEMKPYQVTIIIEALKKEKIHLENILKEKCTSNAVCKIELELERVKETIIQIEESTSYQNRIKNCGKENKDDVGEDAFVMLHQGYDGQKNKVKAKEPVKVEVKEKLEQLSLI